jgi:hypothetical protein
MFAHFRGRGRGNAATQVNRGASHTNPIIVTDSEDEDIIRPTREFILVREDTPIPSLRVTNPERLERHDSPVPREPREVIIPPGEPHGPDSDSDKENIPPHGNSHVQEGEDGNPPPPENCSEPVPGPSRAEHEEEVYLSDPIDQRSRNRRRML